MAVTISFELSENDVQHFIALAREAQDAVAQGGLSREQIVEAARALFDKAGGAANAPAFIAERLLKLRVLADMVVDTEWQLPEDDLNRILSAMAYFANPNDLIPDRVPGIGFLDDAIMVELVLAHLEPEITAYREFCEFRTSEQQRRGDGSDSPVSRGDWLAEKRRALHKGMGQRRSRLGPLSGWPTRIW